MRKQDWHLIEVVVFFVNIDGKLKEYENKCTQVEVLVVGR